MAVEFKQVYSSSVSEIGYDADTESLIVRWTKGSRTSVYSGVSSVTAEQVMNAPSVGQALRETIMPHHEHAYVKDNW